MEIIKIRNICNISIEEKRASKEIGSSLEADLNIKVDKKFQDLFKEIDFSEICITSKANIVYEEDLDVIVETRKMKGKKCPICWKISSEACPRHPE